jgi:hypothetical protein
VRCSLCQARRPRSMTLTTAGSVFGSWGMRIRRSPYFIYSRMKHCHVCTSVPNSNFDLLPSVTRSPQITERFCDDNNEITTNQWVLFLKTSIKLNMMRRWSTSASNGNLKNADLLNRVKTTSVVVLGWPSVIAGAWSTLTESGPWHRTESCY